MKHVIPRPASLVLGVLLGAVLAAQAGCGYSLVRYRGSIPNTATLAIEAISNESYEPGVEAVVLDALRREALQRDGLRLIDDPEAADLVLSGKVRQVVASPRSFSSVVLALEYELYLTLELSAVHRDGTALAIDSRALFGSDTYLASADLEAMRKNRRETIHRLANVMAERVYDSLYESAGP